MAARKPFQFQRFSLSDDDSAMKIGTDGVLLGAWTDCRHATNVLDIGTGCGLIALMIAQRTESKTARILAVEIEAGAAGQAAKNAMNCPWRDRIDIQRQDVIALSTDDKNQGCFDLIVCNPPYFSPSNVGSRHNLNRQSARSSRLLSLESLFGSVRKLLSSYGRFDLILPYSSVNSAVELASSWSLNLTRRTDVRPLPDSEFKRTLLSFSYENQPVDYNELMIETVHHQYTEEFAELTKEFYLRYSSRSKA